jgi:sulfatase modifying factor 1
MTIYGNMIRVKDNFWVSETPITQAFYLKVIGKNPSRYEGSLFMPVENVSWFDAMRFCNKLSELKGLKPIYSDRGEFLDKGTVNEFGYFHDVDNGEGFRLLTKKEWEYSMGKGGATVYAGTSDKSKLDEYAWYGYKETQTQIVRLKKPNQFGLYDMNGNVWEWCYDRASRHSRQRFIVGGSYMSTPSECKINKNNKFQSPMTHECIGIRICKGQFYDYPKF